MLSTSPVQRQLTIRVTPAMPLVPLEVAVFYLVRSVDDVLNLIELGHLEGAFNIGSKEARRREVRIFWRSLVSYDEWATANVAELEYAVPPWVKLAKQRTKPEQATVLLAIIEQILPPLNGINPTLSTIRSADLAVRFACDASHMIGLIAEKEFEFFSKDKKRSPLISRQSAVEFLKRRRIC